MHNKKNKFSAWLKAWFYSPYFAGSFHLERVTDEVRELMCEAAVEAIEHQVQYTDVLLAITKRADFEELFPCLKLTQSTINEAIKQARYKKKPIKNLQLEFMSSAKLLLRVATYQAILKQRTQIEFEDILYGIKNPIDYKSKKVCHSLGLHLNLQFDRELSSIKKGLT